MHEAIIISVTAGSREEAEAIAEALIAGRLAACVQLFPITSLFRWQGEVSREEEVMLAIKTRASLFDTVARTVREHHSYEVPEIVATPVVAGHTPYLDWIAAETDQTR